MSTHLRTALLVLLVVVGVSACRPVYTGPDGRRVAVVGDSITNGSSGALDSSLADQHRFLQGVDGIDLAAGRTRLVKPVVESKPEVMVIELGINSAREEWNSADLADLESVLKGREAGPVRDLGDPERPRDQLLRPPGHRDHQRPDRHVPGVAEEAAAQAPERAPR